MFSLPHFLYALLAFYGVVSVLLIRRAWRPSCRICVHRDYCPVRRASQLDSRVERCYDPQSRPETPNQTNA